MKLAAIIPAAGYSSRMKEFKPLLHLGGRSLLERCAAPFRRAGVETILVVTGHRAKEVKEEGQRLGLVCIHNPDYDQGMFSSICAGVRHLSHEEGFFLLPVDIPLIRYATVSTLLSAYDGRTVLFPGFQDQTGHPPLIPSRLIAGILAYKSDHGLKGFLRQQESRTVPVWDKGILLDADTPEDFASLDHRLSRSTIGDRDEALALARLQLSEQGLAHGLAVARVAVVLGEELIRYGVEIDCDLLHNAALLHDIAKGRPHHEHEGAKMLIELGLAGLADIVAGHKDAVSPFSDQLTEREVVCLADKLVRGPVRVSIRQRFNEKLVMYADDPAACSAIHRRLENALALQSRVEGIIGQDLEHVLNGRNL
jgi:CTP:molybdopterin cytidylyltransferase MocA